MKVAWWGSLDWKESRRTRGEWEGARGCLISIYVVEVVPCYGAQQLGVSSSHGEKWGLSVSQAQDSQARGSTFDPVMHWIPKGQCCFSSIVLTGPYD